MASGDKAIAAHVVPVAMLVLADGDEEVDPIPRRLPLLPPLLDISSSGSVSQEREILCLAWGRVFQRRN